LQFVARAIETQYWRPGHDFLKTVGDSISQASGEFEIIAVSEKAVSVAVGRVVDEAEVKPRFLAKVLARFWMRQFWGRLLGPVCGFRRETVWRLRRYPIPQGEAHKEIALRHAGFPQALLHYSEGGIDVTNLPYALAALPLKDPSVVCEMIRSVARKLLGRDVSVMLVDTDKTFSWQGFHLTSRSSDVSGIRSAGVCALIIGRVLRWKARATPLAMCGRKAPADEALAIAEVADKAMGHGAGRTVWDMARRFRVGIVDVTWEMLERVPHHPIALVKRVK